MSNKFWVVFLLAGLNTAAWTQTAVIRSGYLKVFESPQVGAKKVMTLTEGDTVKVIEQQGAWVKLQLPDKRFGWMQLAELPTPTSSKKSRNGHSTTAPHKARTTTSKESTARRTNENELTAAMRTTPAAAPTVNSSREAKPSEAGSAHSSRTLPVAETHIETGPNISEASTDFNLGISFTLGSLGENFAYSGRFLYRSLPNVYIEGVFQHVPGDVAASLLVHSNLLYSFSLSPRWEGWITGGVGVISTSPTKTVGAKSVSNMELNYGIGVRRYLKQRTYLRADLRQVSVLLDNTTNNYVEVAVGIIIGVR